MKTIKQEVKKEVEMKVLAGIQSVKDRILNAKLLLTEDDCPPEVRKAIESIKQKMLQCKLSQLHPPFLPKTVTRYRHEYFLPLKKEYHSKINSNNPKQFLQAIRVLSSFVCNFDCQLFDMYLEQIREPYIRKMFNENYQFDKIDFKEINTEYNIRTQIENLLNSASEWLIQIQRTQDLLERIQLYFDIKTPIIIQKAKKEGIQTKTDRSFADTINSAIRNVSSFTLRKSSKMVQASLFTGVASTAAMLTLAIIGGSATLPWPSVINGKLLIAPVVALAVPYLLDGLATTIERKEYMQKLEEWAVTLEKVGGSIAKFNEEIEETIINCCSSKDIEGFAKQKVNLQKYVHNLTSNLQNLANFNEEEFQEMRDRTEAYFKQYVQIQDGQWTVVIPSEQYEGEGNLQNKRI